MATDTDYDDDTYTEETYDEAAYEEEDDSWWDEGLITLLLVGGVILFLFPEPFTSAVGIFLVATGVLAWIVDALF